MPAATYIANLLEKAKKHCSNYNFEEALEDIHRVIAFSEGHSLSSQMIEAKLLKGEVLQQQGLYQSDTSVLVEAFQIFEMLLEENQISYSQEKYLLILLGINYYHRQDLENAEKQFQTLLNQPRLVPSDYLYAFSYLAKLSRNQQRLNMAIEYINKAAAYIDESTPLELQMLFAEEKLLTYKEKGDFNKIDLIASEVVELSQIMGNLEMEAKALSIKAIPSAMRGEYKEAFEIINEALYKSEQVNAVDTIAKCLINLGNIFAGLYNFEYAIKNLERTRREFSAVLDTVTLGILHYNLGCSYVEIGQLEKGLANLHKAIELGLQLNHDILMSRAYYEVSKIYIQQHDFDKAFIYSKKAEETYQTSPLFKEEEAHLANMAALQLYQKNYQSCINYGKQAEAVCIRKNNKKTLKRTYKTIADCYKALQDYPNALTYLEKYTVTSEEFMLEVRKKQTIDLEIRYALKEKEQEIELLKSRMQIQTLELSHQKEIEEQNQKLRLTNEELRQFTYAISHDLKEPLRMISSYSKIWFKRHEKHADEKDKEFFFFITDGAERMTNMLQGLLDYATIDKKSLTPTHIHLNEVLTNVKHFLRLKIEEQQAAIEIEELPIIHSHQILIFQLFLNLISNALKFSKKNIPPHVEVGVEEKAKFFVFHVKDNGIGISEDHQEEVFQIFRRLHTQESYEGTGIGLALCQKIVHVLGGELWLSSEINQGTTFYFSLPK